MEAIFGVFLGFLLVFGHHLAEGCTCMPYHPQEHFCTSSFAIKATILSREVFGSMHRGELLYEARIDEIFKMDNDNIKQGANVTIKTHLSGSMCGKTGLQNDTAYVLTGSVSLVNDDLHISLCGLEMPWDQVTAFQRKAFRYFYTLSCTECKVRSQYTRTLYGPSQQCGFRFSGGQDCETKYSTCMQLTKGSCEWLSTSAYKDCIRKRDGTTEEDSGSGFLSSW